MGDDNSSSSKDLSGYQIEIHHRNLSNGNNNNSLINNGSTTKDPLLLTLLHHVPLDLSQMFSLISHNHSNNSSSIRRINSNNSRIFKSNDKVLIEKVSHAPVLVKLTFQQKDKYGILSHLTHDNFVINYISSISAITNNEFLPIFKSNADFSTHSSWRSSLHNESRNNFKISMRPPVENSPTRSSDFITDSIDPADKTLITDPFNYFLDRYFDTLYQMTTPLTFFTKSTFSRLKTLTNESITEKSYETTLKQFLINIDLFDSRHQTANNGIINSQPLHEPETIYRDSFILKHLNLVDFDIHSVDYKETNKTLVNILNNFKVRELHLQIIILLELLYISDRDDPKLFNSNKSKKPQKRRLVGRGKPVSNVTIPTENETLKDFTYNQLLDLYLDKLCIWEMLRSPTSSSENSAAKFITHVIMPFFEKKCPNSLKHMIKKIKGPSFKSLSSASSSSSKKKKSDNEKTLSTGDKKPVTLKRTSSSSSISSTSNGSNPLKRPALIRSSSILENIGELTLKRSKSDLQSLKRNSSFNTANLTKRQVDISKPIITSEVKPIKKTNSGVFNRVGKKLLTTSKNLQELSSGALNSSRNSIPQVEATPMKKNKFIEILETPKDSSSGSQTQVLSSVHGGNTIHSSSPVDMKIVNTPQLEALNSPLVIKSSVKIRPGDPIEFRSPEELIIRGSPSNVRRRLFNPK